MTFSALLACGMVPVLLLTGCLTTPQRGQPSVLGRRLRPKPVVPGANGLFMDVIYLERPVGDPVINRDLWESADEEALELAPRRALEARGFRVGVLGGQLPAKLKMLFDEEELGRMNGEHLQMQAGSATQLQTSGVWPSWPSTDDEPENSAAAPLKDAVGSLRVVPTITAAGCVTLAITPEIQHGEANRRFVPSDQRDGPMDWAMHVGRPVRSFDELRFALPLRSGQFVMLTCLPTRPDSDGARFFTATKDGRLIQRVLLIQAEPSRAALAAQTTPP